VAEDPVGPPRTAEDLFDPEKPKDPSFLEVPQKSADPKALREKAVSDKKKEISDRNDLLAVLSLPEGVRFLARLIGGPCGWNLPYFHGSNSVMCEVAGRRSIGFQLEQWIADVDLAHWFAVRTELEKNRKPKSSSVPGTTARSSRP
jgi:hypothetical protein